MSTPNESHPGSSDQGRQPQDPLVESPFDANYELPNDPVSAEMNLLDTFSERFPDKVVFLHDFLTQVQRHSGMQVPHLQLDSQLGNLERLPTGHFAGHETAIAANIVLKDPAPNQATMDAFEATTEELERYHASRDKFSVQDEVPEYARAMIEGVYGLTGAQTMYVRSEDGGDALIIRRGQYHEGQVFFREKRSVAPESRQVSYSISLIPEHEAEYQKNDQLYGADLESYKAETGLSEGQVVAMNRSGEVTRDNFRDRAALYAATREALEDTEE